MPRILAIETSGQYGAVALLGEEGPAFERSLGVDQRSAQSLAPALVAALADAGWTPDDVDLVAVTVGPGSFTGLRVGVTTAKTFAYAVGAEVLGVDTLEVLAWQAPADAETLWSVIDAHRGELFAAQFANSRDGNRRVSQPAEIVAVEEWLARLGRGDAVTGPVLSRLKGRLPEGVTAVERDLWTPSARSVAEVARRQYAAGRRDDLWQLAPNYMRRSAAEEKRDQRLAEAASAASAANVGSPTRNASD